MNISLNCFATNVKNKAIKFCCECNDKKTLVCVCVCMYFCVLVSVWECVEEGVYVFACVREGTTVNKHSLCFSSLFHHFLRFLVFSTFYENHFLKVNIQKTKVVKTTDPLTGIYWRQNLCKAQSRGILFCWDEEYFYTDKLLILFYAVI